MCRHFKWWDVVGVIGCASFGDSGGSSNWVEFTIWAQLRSMVWNSSLGSRRCCLVSMYPSIICRTCSIARSHTPPKCETRGGLTSQILPCCSQLCLTSSTTSSRKSCCSSLRAPVKLEPASLRRLAPFPRMVWKHLKTCLNEEVSIDSSILRWTAREYRQLNKRTHTYYVPWLALVGLPCLIRKCPKTSMPQL